MALSTTKKSNRTLSVGEFLKIKEAEVALDICIFAAEETAPSVTAFLKSQLNDFEMDELRLIYQEVGWKKVEFTVADKQYQITVYRN